MMIIVNRHADDYISGSYNGIPFGVSYDEVKFDEMKKLETRANEAQSMEEMKSILSEFEPLTKESYKNLVETKCPWVFVNKHTNKFYLKLPAGKVSRKALPKPFVDRILESVDKKIDIMPLVKCWIRFLRNPNYSDMKAERFAWYINQTYTNRELAAKMEKEGLHNTVAVQRATTFQTPITQEGLLVTYKVSKEINWKYVLDEEDEPRQKSRYKKSIDDVTGLITYEKPEFVEDLLFTPAIMGDSGDEFYCGDKPGHLIKVGFSHYLDNWDKVDTNDTRAGVKGLHCGNQDYIRNFQSPGTVTHYVFVDPMDIGAVVQDNTGALRVKRYFVHASFAGTNKSIYHSSTYAALTDKEYREMLSEAITATGELKEGIDEDLAEKHALID